MRKKLKNIKKWARALVSLAIFARRVAALWSLEIGEKTLREERTDKLGQETFQILQKSFVKPFLSTIKQMDFFIHSWIGVVFS